MKFLAKLFGGSREEAALKDAMKLIWQLVDDERYQNELLPSAMSDPIKNGSGVDKIPNATGSFGLERGNAIPVNGALGELSYLSRLETLNGENLLFHRIGAIDMTDVFEAVTMNGTSWHVFFLDLYHSRRSRLAPDSFRLGKPRQFSGFHTYCPNFPYDFVECKAAVPDGLRIAYIAISNVVPALQAKLFSRPMAHKAKLTIVEGLLTSRHT